MESRLKELDALRGLAALTVFIAHILAIFKNATAPEFAAVGPLMKLLDLTPLSILWASSQAVLLFFILSGFVLTTMLAQRTRSYSDYIIRRSVRLWIPYAASIALAAMLIVQFGSEKIPDLSPWLNKFLGTQFTWSSFLAHLAFVGHYPSDEFNFVVWTVQQEMRISLIMPLILAFVMRHSLRNTVLLFSILSIACIPLVHLVWRTGFPDLYTYPATGHYVLFFVIGILMAIHLPAIRSFYSALSRPARIAGAIGALLFYSSIPNAIAQAAGVKLGMFFHWLLIPGTCLVMIYAMCSSRVKKLLNRPVFDFFGRISYSLYLYHGILLVFAMHMFYGKYSLWIILPVCFGATILISTLMYRWIEVPSIKAGKKLAARWSSRTAVTAAS